MERNRDWDSRIDDALALLEIGLHDMPTDDPEVAEGVWFARKCAYSVHDRLEDGSKLAVLGVACGMTANAARSMLLRMRDLAVDDSFVRGGIGDLWTISSEILDSTRGSSMLVETETMDGDGRDYDG